MRPGKIRAKPKCIRIATRKSQLALWQAKFIRARLIQAHPGLEVELLKMSTKGDRWLSTPLSDIGGKGLFVKELESALLDGSADIAVHSMKDVPALLPRGFSMPVIGFRADVRDALVGRTASTLQHLRAGAVIGSSSLRRKTQLLHRRPDLEVRPVRGNVGTRLAKLDQGDFDALVLAAAGLQRLQLENRVTQYMAIEDSLPAAGQGALGIECCTDARVLELLDALKDVNVFRCVSAERRVSEALGGDCSMPLAAYCERQRGELKLRALLSDSAGTRVLRATACGKDWQTLGDQVAQQLYAQGAEKILQSLTVSGSEA